MKRLLLLALLVCLGVGCGSSHACSSGNEVVLRAVPQHGETLTPAGMKLARNIIAGRLGSLGVSSPTVEIRGSDEIVISGVPKNLTKRASVTGNLQFFDFEKDLARQTVENGNPTPYPTLYSLLSAPGTSASNAPPGAFYLFAGGPSHRLIQGPTGTLKDVLAPYGGEIPKGAALFTVPANTEVVSGRGTNFTGATHPVRRSPDGRYWYLLKLPPEISGDDLKESAIEASHDTNTGLPQVTLGFTPRGGREFEAITKAEYDRGLLVAGLHGSPGRFDPRYAQHQAIVLDNRIEATPYIDYTDASLSLGIPPGNGIVISNMGSTQAANNLALVLQSGSLPYRFEKVSSKLCTR